MPKCPWILPIGFSIGHFTKNVNNRIVSFPIVNSQSENFFSIVMNDWSYAIFLLGKVRTSTPKQGYPNMYSNALIT
jgi:hypothetical protein